MQVIMCVCVCVCVSYVEGDSRSFLVPFSLSNISVETNTSLKLVYQSTKFLVSQKLLSFIPILSCYCLRCTCVMGGV